MTRETFMEELREILEVDDLTVDTRLAGQEGFDSLAVMSIVAFVFSRCRKKLTGAEVKNAATVGDLLTLVGSEAFSG